MATDQLEFSIAFVEETPEQLRIRVLEKHVVSAARKLVEETDSTKDQSRLCCLDLAVAYLDRAIRNLES